MWCPEQLPGSTVRFEYPDLCSGAELRPVSCLSGRREGKEFHSSLCEALKERDQSLTEKRREQTVLRTA